MTIDEAIKDIKDNIKPVVGGKSLDMAIDALEFRERYDYFWEEVKSAGMKGKETEVHHSGRVFRIREVAQ